MNKTPDLRSADFRVLRRGRGRAFQMEELGCSYYSAIYNLHQNVPDQLTVWMIHGIFDRNTIS